MQHIGSFTVLAFVFWIISSWITHAVICIKSASWGLLIAGSVFFPVGVIHGTGAWFGAW